MTSNEEQIERSLVLVPPKSIIPIEEIGLSPVETHVGLTSEFRNQVARFNEVMTSKTAGDMSGIGRIDYFIQPGINPVVERQVTSDTSLYLRVSIVPGKNLGTGTIQLLLDTKGIKYVSHYGIESIPDALFLDYTTIPEGLWIEFEDLQDFVREAFPNRKCEILARTDYTSLPPYSRNFLRLKRETWEKFWWKTALDYTPKLRKMLRHIKPYRAWELYIEGQKIPIVFFTQWEGRVFINTEDPERSDLESRIFCRIPHFYFAGSASEATHVLTSLNNLLQKNWEGGGVRVSRPTTIWQRWYDGKEPHPK